MLRCITDDNKTLIATSCETETTRALSRAHKLFCPNCKNLVQYNKGRVKSSYFSHINLECQYIGSEPETQSHIKGKELLFNWLKKNILLLA
ncbi:competence CoiA-like predicted nuclease [Paenibacillus sp. 4624]|uniref:competence protein CoiA family protein n=1 Tax=Paenibacillus sp. 4624 TaxID=3156453 RepID=UPI003D246415